MVAAPGRRCPRSGLAVQVAVRFPDVSPPPRIPPLPPGPIHADHVTLEIRGDGDAPGGRLVLMDGVEASHVDIGDPTRIAFEYLRHVTRLVDAAWPEGALSAVQVGGGPCTLARWLLATRPGSRVTVVERDAGVVEAARRWLALPSVPDLAIVVGDGRARVARMPPASADLLVVDAFVGLVAPPSLVSEDFAAIAARVLRPGGILVVNMIDVPPLAYARAVAATAASAWHDTLVMADARVLAHRSPGNLVVAAAAGPLPLERLRRGVAREPAPWSVLAGRPLARFREDAPVVCDDMPPGALDALTGPLAVRR